MLTGTSAEIERIDMIESCDPSGHPLPDILLDLGLGKKPEELSFDSPQAQYFAQRLFPAAVSKLAGRLGVTLDKIELGDVDLAFATDELKIGSGTIAKGTISGLNYQYIGYRDDCPFLTHRWVHYVERSGVPEGWLLAPEAVGNEANPYLVDITIVGRPSLHSKFTFTDPEDSVWLPTAAVAIRSIPAVCAAAPGLLEDPMFGAWTPA
jgi:2,4-diaminopentanoate dehydrogenase